MWPLATPAMSHKTCCGILYNTSTAVFESCIGMRVLSPFKFLQDRCTARHGPLRLPLDDSSEHLPKFVDMVSIESQTLPS